MKHFLILLTAVFMISFSGFAQDKIIKHTVGKDETIEQISKKYKVTPADIYRLNPDSKKGIKPNMVLLIQSKDTVAKAKTAEQAKAMKVAKVHVVAEKETFYSLSKMYNVSVDELQKANPEATQSGLKPGTVLQIPTADAKAQQAPKAEKAEKEVKKTNDGTKNIVYYEVVAGDTKYSIAKKYGTTVKDLEATNPEIVSGLALGYRLKIVGGNPVKEDKTKDTIKKTAIVKPVAQSGKQDIASNEIKAKTLASTTDRENDGKAFTNLSQSLSTQNKKQLVLLLPFNISKIEKDTVTTISNRLKADKFLNMTLDFYSGALIAVDSAKTLGLNIDVKIFDSQETKNSSNVASIIQQNDLQSAHVVIGPFYQANVEKTAEILSKNNVPVISPLSKDSGKVFPNLIQSMPSFEMAKNAMFDYIHSKNGNILAILDSKKISSKMYLTQNHKDVQFVGLDVKGAVVSDSVVKKFVKNKINYVILDSEKTGMILKTLNVLTEQLAFYQIQLVILEKNETLEFEEIPLMKLAKLKLLYPSFTKGNESPEALIFEKQYKAKNKIFPNQYATRGFDVTFDTMMRLSQEADFMTTINETKTEQVESKFQYEKRGAGFVNTGIYILQYDTDLSVKEAK